MTAGRWRIETLLVLLPLLGASACDRPSVLADTPPKPRARAPVAVRVTEVVATELTDPIHGTGVIVADKTTDIGPTVDGILEQVLVEVGDRVRRGQPLFRLRRVDYRLRVERETASVALAEAELEKSTLDLQRTAELRRENVVSDDRFDAASTANRIAGAKLEKARAELAKAEQDLRDTTVSAPYDGVITRRGFDEGAFVRALAGPSGGIVQLQKVDRVIAVVHVPEVALLHLGVGIPASIRIDGMGREYQTEVGIMNDLVERSSHTVELRLPLDNPDLSIKPGLFVEVELRPPGRRALVLDRRAVFGPAEAALVWTLSDHGRAERRAVEVKKLDAERVEVLSGVAAGDRILLPGAEAIEEGTPLYLEGSEGSEGSDAPR